MTSSPPLADRFAALTGEQRQRLMRRLVAAGQAEAIPAVVPPRDGDAPLRLSPAQEDLWVFDELYPDTAALNLCCAYHFEGPVDPAELERALTLLRRNHDVLRTRLGGPPEAPDVSFPPAEPFVLERVDLRGSERQLDDVFAEFRRRPFDLRGEGLMRGRFVTVDDRRRTLMLSLHHIVTDWWSFDVLHTEFAETYRVVREGGAPPPRPAIQYADFAAWQRELERAGVFEARLAFWRDYLADPPQRLAPHGPAPAASGRSPAIAQLPFRLGADVERRTRALARERGTTVYGVLMSAFAAFAGRLGDTDDLVLGTPVANRAAKGLERVIGYVMNAVPTRWRIGPDTTFGDLLGGFATDFPRVLAHADLPVGRIVAATAPERDAGRSPLFQWVFMYLPRQESVRRIREFAEPERIHTGGEHDLVCVVQDADDGFAGTIEVRVDRLPAAVVAHWAESFATFLARLLAAPEAPVAAHRLLTPEAHRRLLATPPGPPAERPPGLPALVERWAAERPTAPALDDGDTVLDYATLADRVARLAGRLAALGAGPGTLVALALGRSAAATVATLAVQRAGAAHLPVDPGHPERRVRQLLADARPVLLLVAPDAAPPAGSGTPTLVVDDDAWSGEPLTARPPLPDEAAYVIHTSGTTGRPKGVVVPHAGVATLAGALADAFALDPDSRVLQAGSPTFDISVAELAMAFHAGATLVVPPPGGLAGEALAEVLRESRISATLLPPALLAGVAPDEVPELRTVGVGAEPCPPALVALWAGAGRRMVNAYGPTEATVAVTLSDPLDGAAETVPIGRPVAGVRAHVLDRALRPVPVGVAGELYVGGPGLARGYLGGAARTAERFLADPHGPPGARMYRTGDLVRRRPDGQLDFLARVDAQVQLRGLRVEPAEVASALAEHPAVDRAVVAVRGQRLVGYVVPRAGEAPPAPEELRAFLGDRLPAALVPTAFLTLEAVPLTPAGKTDLAALPAPEAAEPAGDPAPGDPRATAIGALFAEVLGVPSVGAHDGFFDLGGDSVKAIQLAHRARAVGLAFTPAELFGAQTPDQLAPLARVVEAKGGGAGDDGVGRAPLTPMAHWWLAQGGEPDRFLMAALLPTPADSDEKRIDGALRTLARRHGALRLRLVGDADDGPAVEVPPAATHPPAPADRVAAAGWSAEEVTARAGALAAATRIDPEAGPPLRAVWFDAGPGRGGRLLLVVHHLAVDGVSWRVVARDLAALLADPAADARTLPPPGASFRRWATLLAAEASSGDRLRAQLPYWRQALAGPEARLAPGVAVAGERATVVVELSAEQTAPLLRELPNAWRCGTETVLLTALAAAGARWRGDGGALLVDLEGHGRDGLPDGPDVSEAVGWFTTQYPVRLDAAGEATGEALRRVKERLRAVPSTGLGWGLLRRLDREAGHELARLPLPDVRFNYLGAVAGTSGDAPEVELLGMSGDALPLAHLVELDAVVGQGPDGPRLLASWSYAAGALDEAGVRELAGLWSSALDALVAHTRTGAVAAPSAADFPLVELSDDQLQAFEGEL
ncbi:non-ribosomal peptide synthetase [Streptomyces profundus]|uniref:non-ribosomal peptide synthetase n=1 Tax=Streptomyces profundus TaxID=2867410 RepID=UPI001D169001|nr:non-ribosomal peptide synthetase [Streptomyces sp. MA3_2.13]UED83919.1 amino acid adenylation domain-containing protein [Streptomyces sp. MA3_2.13]